MADVPGDAVGRDLAARHRRAALAVGLLGAVLTVATLLLAGSGFITQAIANGCGIAVGVTIVRRGSSDAARRMGWIVTFAMTAIQVGALSVASDWLLDRGHTEAARWVAALFGSHGAEVGLGPVTALAMIPIVFLAVTFPDGRLRRGWGWYPWLVGAVGTTLVVSALLSPVYIGRDRITKPFLEDVAAEAWLEVSTFGLLGVALLLLVSMTSLVGRYRDPATTLAERQQIKWFAFGIGSYFVVVTGLLVGELLGVVSGTFFTVVDGLAFTLIPISLGVAILRYRLYDIDRIISRTLAYALTFVLMTGVFVAIVTSPVIFAHRAADSFPPLLVSISTLVVAALFNPVRRRVVRRLERRFDRAHYDAELVVEEFSDRISHLTDIDDIQSGLVDVFGRTLAPASIGIWIAKREP